MTQGPSASGCSPAISLRSTASRKRGGGSNRARPPPRSASASPPPGIARSNSRGSRASFAARRLARAFQLARPGAEPVAVKHTGDHVVGAEPCQATDRGDRPSRCGSSRRASAGAPASSVWTPPFQWMCRTTSADDASTSATTSSIRVRTIRFLSRASASAPPDRPKSGGQLGEVVGHRDLRRVASGMPVDPPLQGSDLLEGRVPATLQFVRHQAIRGSTASIASVPVGRLSRPPAGRVGGPPGRHRADAGRPHGPPGPPPGPRAARLAAPGGRSRRPPEVPRRRCIAAPRCRSDPRFSCISARRAGSRCSVPSTCAQRRQRSSPANSLSAPAPARGPFGPGTFSAIVRLDLLEPLPQSMYPSVGVRIKAIQWSRGLSRVPRRGVYVFSGGS